VILSISLMRVTRDGKIICFVPYLFIVDPPQAGEAKSTLKFLENEASHGNPRKMISASKTLLSHPLNHKTANHSHDSQGKSSCSSDIVCICA
jgi:hypothetical protein